MVRIDCSSLTRLRRDALGIVTLVVAPFSVIGSLLICYTILQKMLKNKKRTSSRSRTRRSSEASPTFERIMLGLSVTDLISSISMATSAWMIPKSEHDYDVSFAIGNVASCKASGFLLHFWFGTMIYMAILCIYYVAVICFDKKEDYTRRWIEPWAHILGMSFPIFFGIYALHSDMYNPVQVLPGFCTVAVYPFGCDYVEGLECTRGGSAVALAVSYYLSTSVLALVWSIIIGSMSYITWHVHKTEKRIQRYSVASSSDAEDYQRTRRAFSQAMCYVGACSVTALPALVGFAIHSGSASPLGNLLVAIFAKTMLPLQGVLNALIYFRNNPQGLQGGGRFAIASAITKSVSSVFLHWMNDTSNDENSNMSSSLGIDISSVPSMTLPNSAQERTHEDFEIASNASSSSDESVEFAVVSAAATTTRQGGSAISFRKEGPDSTLG